MMADLFQITLADCEMSVRLRSCLDRGLGLGQSLADVKALDREQRIKLVSCGGAYAAALREIDSMIQEAERAPDIRLPDLQDITYGPKVYFATLKFYSYVTTDGPDRRALTPALEHYARAGWRPVGVWTSGSDGTWIEVLLQRESGK